MSAADCSVCGKPHGLSELDAGSEREVRRLCESCYENGPRDDVRPGDLFWDSNRDWCYGSKDTNLCYLVLSADMENGLYLYRCNYFSWVAGHYMGGPERKLTRNEILKMERVGNISQIKAFDE